MNVIWDVVGKGEWYDSMIMLIDFFIGFDQL